MQGLFFFTTLVTVSFLLCVLSNLSKLVSFSSFFFYCIAFLLFLWCTLFQDGVPFRCFAFLLACYFLRF